jgi:hypothetical protein
MMSAAIPTTPKAIAQYHCCRIQLVHINQNVGDGTTNVSTLGGMDESDIFIVFEEIIQLIF